MSSTFKRKLDHVAWLYYWNASHFSWISVTYLQHINYFLISFKLIMLKRGLLSFSNKHLKSKSVLIKVVWWPSQPFAEFETSHNLFCDNLLVWENVNFVFAPHVLAHSRFLIVFKEFDIREFYLLNNVGYWELAFEAIFIKQFGLTISWANT